MRSERATKRGERDCNGSHSRASRQALLVRGFKEGELADVRAENKKQISLDEELPCSFDGHNDFVGTHHVQTTTSGLLDSAWIGTQLFNLDSQRLVCIT